MRSANHRTAPGRLGLCALIPAILCAGFSQAQQAQPPPATKSGYDRDFTLEGPDSVAADLALDDLEVEPRVRFSGLDRALEPWFDAKRRLNEKLGLQLQLSYQWLYLNASESPGEHEAASGRAEFQGSWAQLGSGGSNPGILNFRLEERDRLGTEISPSALSRELGTLTAGRSRAGDGGRGSGGGTVSDRDRYS